MGFWSAVREFLGVSSGPAGVETRAEDGPSVPSRSVSPSLPTAGEALGLSAVYRAIELRANALRQLSCDVERNGAAVDTPLFIRRPDIGTPFVTFVEQTSVSLDTNGNAYWRIRRDSASKIQSLEVLNPLDVTVRTSESGRVVGYSYRGYDLKPEDVQHLSRLRVPGTPYGLGPIQAARVELRGAIDTAAFASEYFDRGDHVSGVLKSDQVLTGEDATRARDQWETTRGGRSGVAVLGAGLTYSATYISPADAQWLESRQFDVTTVARMFGIPASLLLTAVAGTSLTYANVVDEWQTFVRWGLMGTVSEIETALTELLPRGQRARFNLEALLRPDTAKRYEAHAAAIGMGLYSPAYAREIEGIPDTAAPKENAA